LFPAFAAVLVQTYMQLPHHQFPPITPGHGGAKVDPSLGPAAVRDPISQYFQCAFDVRRRFKVAAPLSAAGGYFGFGPGIVCYGRTGVGYQCRRADHSLYDASKDLSSEEFTVRLPFDPTEVITNLTHERYARGLSTANGDLGERLVRHLYYVVRPLLPLGVRSQMQKFYLRNWRDLRFPAWPVDPTVDVLMKTLLRLGMKAAGVQKTPFIWFWPDGASACSIMSHDVETEAGKQLCSKIMDMDDEFRIPASFQIVPEERYGVPRDFIDGIKARGFEVNVQDLNHDGRLFWRYDKFKEKAEKINQYGRKLGAVGFRSAVLYRNQEWYDLLDFEYDMSVPNVAHLDPQRGGCCTVMPYFIGDVLELPVTTTQDHSLFHILNDYSLDLWRHQIDLILKQNGLISFIIHPDYIVGDRAPAAYRSLLSELNQLRSERNVWIAHPREVNRWWRQRSEMRLVSNHGQLAIEGEGNQRARVAIASVEGDEIVYSLPAHMGCIPDPGGSQAHPLSPPGPTSSDAING
jgi:hypothetical protein